MIIGTAQFGSSYGVSNKFGKPNLNSVTKILETAIEGGITLLDTSPSYNDSEHVIGESGLSNQFEIISKLPRINGNKCNIGKFISEQIQRSLSNVKKQNLYAYHVHYTQDLLTNGYQIWDKFKELKFEGLTQKIGYSVYYPSELDNLYYEFKPDVIQLPMNILDREFLHSGWLERLKSDGVEVHVRSAFLQGLLLLPKQEQKNLFPNHENLWNLWEEYLVNSRVSAITACLDFLVNSPYVDEIIIGICRVTELQEILASSWNNNSPQFEMFSEDRTLIKPNHWKL